ncbi:DUF4430 domain-containing protein [Infirmifilum lucidum]|uniref:DUF4430 domain-containing protein n=1 Tax=Infirmifilum lucidum TaxID=2776706 RepID=A0A7L9FFS2_9CREN|nr:DUF4430 domain-containing protein [Infirmifilum lucidum]QOJ78589.1 DUF4430 domain-containing protein [Infirmifilum lucidum]
MPQKQNYLLVAVLAWAIIATTLASYLYLENNRLSREISYLGGRVVIVNVGIDYGNGTIAWFNSTALPRGSTALTALVSVAQVEYKLGSWGAYVTSVNSVQEKIISKNEGYSWMWYRYDQAKKALVLGEVAADKYKLASGETIVWRYEHWKF